LPKELQPSNPHQSSVVRHHSGTICENGDLLGVRPVISCKKQLLGSPLSLAVIPEVKSNLIPSTREWCNGFSWGIHNVDEISIHGGRGS